MRKGFAPFQLSDSVCRAFFRVFTDPHFARGEEGLQYLKMWRDFAHAARDMLLPGCESGRKELEGCITSSARVCYCMNY